MKKNRNAVTVGRKMGKLEWEARFVIGKQRRGAKETREDLMGCLGSIGRAMQRYGLNSIKDIKPGHVRRYFAELKTAGLSESRMANHATALRKLCKMMGKSDIVPNNRELGCSRNLANRTKHADERMNVEKAAEARSRLSENSIIAYDMARLYGLRQKETLLSNEKISRDGVDYLVVEGAKGGRPRQVPITTQDQLDVLARNHVYRTAHGGKLIDTDKSLKQGLRQLQNELAKSGAGRNSGANMHTLRREWIIERCERIAALPEDKRQEMLKDLMESVGHGREEVVRCYTNIMTSSSQ